MEHLLIVETPRLLLINTTSDLLDTLLQKGTEGLASALQVSVVHDWTMFGLAPFEYVRMMLDKDPDSTPWWSWLPVLKSEQKLAGTGGFKGPPKDGMVEIGYEIIPELQGKGLATEYAAALIRMAFQHPEVTSVIAHTLAHENASCAVLRKTGFILGETIEDPEDGTIWQWRKLRPVP